jgi:hypothetical protein
MPPASARFIFPCVLLTFFSGHFLLLVLAAALLLTVALLPILGPYVLTSLVLCGTLALDRLISYIIIVAAVRCKIVT